MDLFPNAAITIGFSAAEFSVSEDAGFVLVSVSVTGFPADVMAEAHVLLYTRDVTAEGEYVPIYC